METSTSSTTEDQLDLLRPARNRWSWEKLSFLDYLPSQELALVEGEDFDGYQSRLRNRKDRTGFARGRVKAIVQLMEHYHGGPCDTDDAIVYVEAALPFVVEAAELSGRSAFIMCLAWVRKHCPRYAIETGTETIAEMINGMLDQRDRAEKKRQAANWQFVDWLPQMHKLVMTLRPTFDVVTSLGLRGWGSIDRPSDAELRARKTERQKQARRDRGVADMSSRSATANLAALAEEIGKSLRTLERWKAKGILDAKVEELRVGKVRHPYIDDDGSLRFPTFSAPANDDTPAPIVPANDDHPEPALPLTETGFVGRNITLSAYFVQAALDQHPALNDDLPGHLEAIDAMMAKTPKYYHARVRRNLLRDRNRLAQRLRRQRAANEDAKAEAAA